MNIGFIFKELRSLKGVSQQEMASLLNVERSTYCKWETDRIKIDVNRLYEISKIYGLDLEYMSRCIEAGKVISKNDVIRFMQTADAKAKAKIKSP